MNKILLIDDEPDIVRVLGISLRADGYEVIPALSGAEGLEAFAKNKPEIVITDIKMPGMNGIEVLEKIKHLDPNTEVIIITGHGDIDNTIEALKYTLLISSTSPSGMMRFQSPLKEPKKSWISSDS